MLAICEEKNKIWHVEAFDLRYSSRSQPKTEDAPSFGLWGDPESPWIFLEHIFWAKKKNFGSTYMHIYDPLAQFSLLFL